MLNVPDTVKALFKRDGVRKNFRVHFPNGELPDITNDNVVQESVKFTESLCSQDVLKFGLTEASVIEFETVGIGNMYGMTIECGIEIDLSSLSAAQISDIASGTWDGVYTAVGDSDIGYAYFRVPYGTFRVESCPRDHQAMTHRKVEAFGLSGKLGLNPFETNKLNTRTGNTQYTPNINLLYYSLCCWSSTELLEQDGFTTKVEPYKSATSRQKTDAALFLTDGTTAGISVKQYYTRFHQDANNEYLPPDYLYCLNYKNNWNPEQMFKDIAAIFESWGNIDLERMDELYNTGKTYYDLAKYFLRRSLNYAYPFVIYYTEGDFSGGLIRDQRLCYIYEENKAIYPMIGDKTYFTVDVPYGVVMSVTHGNVPQGTFYDNTVSVSSERPTLERYETPQTIQTIRMWFNSTLKSVYRNVPEYSFSYCYSIINFINGFLELKAQFGKTNRLNQFEVVRLENDSPIYVIPGEYSGLWWDEYDVLPIGNVKYSFTDSENEENIVVYEFSDGQSTYDMTDNEVLKNLTGASQASIETFLDNAFIPYLSTVSFTPIDLTMKGLPYMEAVDYLAVTAEDGAICNSFNMKMEISGIQVLTANIESTSGDIIESGES